jgi:leader peptidase (prepilin peptidase)/N-methyltransferase
MVCWLLMFWLFVIGTVVGSMLNVCIYRLPLEKSILWPGSRCGHCLQPIRWYDNIPLVSYLVLRGRCRTCGTRFSVRYFLIELFTGLCFAGLFYFEIAQNIHYFPALQHERDRMEWALRFPSWTAWTVFAYHAVLVSLLIVASFCDLDRREIPLGITLPGTALGLVGAMLLPWPWPNTASLAQKVSLTGPWWVLPPGQIPEGLYPWPFWGPLPAWFSPGGNWQTGLVTGLAGALLGTLMVRAIRFLFGLGLGMEALGLGDADLMMMAGSFLGWQPIVVAFFIGVFAGLIFGIGQLLIRRDNVLAFGPSLSVGIVAACLSWYWIGPHFQALFFNGLLIFPLAGISCVLMLGSSYLLRILRLMASRGA